MKIGRLENSRLDRLAKKSAKRRHLLKKVAEKEAAEELELAEGAAMARWSDDDLRSALRKVAEAGVNYNRNALGPAKLKAFDGSSMKPELFARQVFATFGIKLTRRELASLVHRWDADGDGTIDSTEFMVHFFRYKASSSVSKGKQNAGARELYGYARGGGWTMAMPPVGRPSTTSSLFLANGGTGSMPTRGSSLPSMRPQSSNGW